MFPGALLQLVVITSLVAGLTGCGSPPTAKSSTIAVGSGTEPSDNVGSPSNQSDMPAGPLTYAAPVGQACMLHQQAGGYYTCLSGADGQCFHYGAVCEPTDTCVPDLASGELKVCKKFTEGRCDSFGKLCKPKGTCVYDMKERRYRTCSKPKTGGCSEYGVTCAPS